MKATKKKKKKKSVIAHKARMIAHTTVRIIYWFNTAGSAKNAHRSA